MSLLTPTRLVPLGAQFFLHGAALVLALRTLSRMAVTDPSAYVPWLVGAGCLLAALLVVWSPRPIPALAVLVVWTLAVHLNLLPAGFSMTFQLLIIAPVLVQTVLLLPSAFGPLGALAELGLFLTDQQARTAWGYQVEAAGFDELWGLAAIGAALVLGAWALRSAFRKREALEAELVHLKEGVQQVVQANVGFQELAAEVEQSSIRRERLRITREIHDIVGYTLTNQTMVLQAAVVLLDRDHAKLRDLLDSAQESARSGLQEVRQALRQLRVGADRPLAFLNRVNQLCRTFERATGVKVDLSGAQTPDNIPPSLELVLYRMVQEGLTNAFLHGKATRVTVGLVLDAQGLSVHLSDNGKGTGAGEVTEGIGLSGMRERLGPFGGTFDYSGGPHGFTVWARIPRASLKEEL